MFETTKKNLVKSVSAAKLNHYFLLRLEHRIKTFKQMFTIPLPAKRVSETLVQKPASAPLYRLKLKVANAQEQAQVLAQLHQLFSEGSSAACKFNTPHYRNAIAYHHFEYGAIFVATLPPLTGDNTHERLIYVGISDRCDSRKFFNSDGSFKTI